MKKKTHTKRDARPPKWMLYIVSIALNWSAMGRWIRGRTDLDAWSIYMNRVSPCLWAINPLIDRHSYKIFHLRGQHWQQQHRLSKSIITFHFFFFSVVVLLKIENRHSLLTEIYAAVIDMFKRDLAKVSKHLHVCNMAQAMHHLISTNILYIYSESRH